MFPTFTSEGTVNYLDSNHRNTDVYFTVAGATSTFATSVVLTSTSKSALATTEQVTDIPTYAWAIGATIFSAILVQGAIKLSSRKYH